MPVISVKFKFCRPNGCQMQVQKDNVSDYSQMSCYIWPCPCSPMVKPLGHHVQ